MPSFYPENNTPLPADNERKSLHKIVSILNSGGGAVSSGNPVVQTGKADSTALAANPSRKRAFIQNAGTNILYVKEGAGCTTSSWSGALPGGTANDDGRGGTYSILSDDIITVAVNTGTARYSVTEIS